MLVRAAEPLEGMEVMLQGRGTRRGASAPPLKPHQLCNGPSKLCQALALTKAGVSVCLYTCLVFCFQGHVGVNQIIFLFINVSDVLIS